MTKFTNFLKNNRGNQNSFNQRGNQQPARPAQAPRPASEGQKSYYKDICKRKGQDALTQIELDKMTFVELGKLIGELNQLPDPLTQAQADRIQKDHDHLTTLNQDLRVIVEAFLQENSIEASFESSKDFIASLTGGRDGTGSLYIQFLYKVKKSLSHLEPATDEQAQRLTTWFLCPDIPFEDFNIEKRVDLGDGYWRPVTSTEFEASIKANMKRQEASQFITRHQGKFYEWSRTRITKNQMDYIHTLEDRLAEIHVPKEVEHAVIDGKLVQVTTVSNRDYYNPLAYNRTDDFQLAQMSSEEATMWISMLHNDIEMGNRYAMMEDDEGNPENHTDTFDNARQDYYEETRGSMDIDKAKDQALEDFQSLIYSFEAILGYRSEGIHELINDANVEGAFILMNDANREKVREFMMSTVTADQVREEEEWVSQMARVFNMCEGNDYAIEILDPTYNEE